jgi:2-methylcitrate dehydratase PrpD
MRVHLRFRCEAVRNACTLTVQMRSGEEYTKSVDSNRGSVENPLSKAEQMNKFKDCTKDILSEGQTDRCLNLIEGMEGLKGIDQLTDIIRI